MNGVGGNRIRPWVARFAIVIALGALLGRLGPFGTFAELGTVERYSYWIGLTLLMWLQCLAALAVLATRWTTANRFVLAIVAALAGSVPTAFEVAWAEMVLRVERDLGIADVAMIYGDVVLLAVPLMLVGHALIRTGKADAPASGGAEGNADWLIAKLPPDRRGRLLALQSEDHYVRVRTTAGDQLLHMRFGAAMARLAPNLGCQVHRSWWIARDAVRSQRRERDRIIVELLDGTEVPISRSYAIAARAAGLIGAS